MILKAMFASLAARVQPCSLLLNQVQRDFGSRHFISSSAWRSNCGALSVRAHGGGRELTQQVVREEDPKEKVEAEGTAIRVIQNARLLDTSELNTQLSDDHLFSHGAKREHLDWLRDERIQRSCEAGSKLRVAVLVSGGVDSSVALRLLSDAGHHCTAFYLKIWFQEDFENFWSACPWEEDLSFAQRVCDEVGVQLEVIHLTDAFWTKVVAESLAEVKVGRTANPDMLCNSKIKFGEFIDRIKDRSFDRIASGHYARVERSGGVLGPPVVRLCLSPDPVKDQTYFLSQLSSDQLTRLMFPLGCLSKAEVRQVAEAMGLANKQRKDSQGICFLGKVKFSEFIGRHLGEKEGFMVDAETGEILGLHRGYWFYTIGQRQGLRLSHGPWFVVAKDFERNVVFISRKYFSDKKRRSFRVGYLNWIAGCAPTDLTAMRCKLRHGTKFYDCLFQFDPSTESEGRLSTAAVHLAEDDQGIAPGQYAAFYQGDVCLGSGKIVEALGEDQQVNVSSLALQAARTSTDTQIWKDSQNAQRRSHKFLIGSSDNTQDSQQQAEGDKDVRLRRSLETREEHDPVAFVRDWWTSLWSKLSSSVHRR